MKLSKITFTVSNDIGHDQRMQRICHSLAHAGWDVTLVGRLKPASTQLSKSSFNIHRLGCYFHRGFLFYAEYNFRLLWYLLRADTEVISAVDLDTLMACSLASRLRGRKLYFDAHEIFTEVPELKGRGLVKAIWTWIGRRCINNRISCYTVNESLASILSRSYGVPFTAVYNYPVLSDHLTAMEIEGPLRLLYQGMVNQGRGVLEAIEAIKDQKDISLDIIGDGDIIQEVRSRVSQNPAAINLLGYVSPKQLKLLTSDYHIGLNLLDASSDNYYYSSANKFYDYIMAGLPVITMGFPEYRKIIDEYELGVVVGDLKASTILDAVLQVKDNYAYHRAQCLQARQKLQWSIEERKLIAIYSSDPVSEDFA